jgi:DNA polymerase I-like protein with 3'-5' exonuclease and polymerase domains
LNLDKAPQTSDWNAPHLNKRQIEYAAIDAVVAWRIAGKVLPYLHVQRGAYEIQMRAVPAVMRMEMRGVKLDVDAHAQLIDALHRERIEGGEQFVKACRQCGLPATLAPSTPNGKAAFLERLLTSEELARWKRTDKSGALSTKRSELLRAGHYPPVLSLVNIIRIDKLLAPFLA